MAPGRAERWRRALEAAHAVTLGLWLGVLVMGAVVAGRTFPMMRDLDPALPAYGGDEHWRIAAGHVAAFIFSVVDVAQFVAVLLAVLTLTAIVRLRGAMLGRVSALVRAIALGVAMLLVAAQLLLIGPRITASMHRSWAAAQQGDLAAAEAQREAVAFWHPWASRTLGATALCVLVALGAGVWSASGAAREARREATP